MGSRRIAINNPRLGPPALGTGLPPGVSRSDWEVPSISSVSAVSSGPSVSSVTSSVVSQLQPSIAAAVAEALKASSRPVSRPQAVKAVEEPNYGPAKYNFGYKVADEESQAYINHQESREGNDVTGSYNYVNPAGALVTVNYEAGVDGFSQTRDVEQGAVQMRNIPGAWTGPLADVDEVAPVSNNRASVSSSSSSQLSQEALTSQILSTIQPKITSAVQGAISASSKTAGRRTVVQQVAAVPQPQAVRVAAPRPVASVSSSSSQEALISQILSSIQPKISSAVQGALSSQTAGRRTVQQVAAAPTVRVAAPRAIASRPRPGVIAPSSRRVQSSSSSSRGVQSSSTSRGSGLGDVFGNGETSVKFATPQFQFEF